MSDGSNSDNEFFDDFDATQHGFDFIQNVLGCDPPIPREDGDTALVVHLARHNVPLLRQLLDQRVAFPRDSCMDALADGIGAISYDSTGARLLIEAGGRPAGTWLLQAMLANDADAATRLDKAGARLSADQHAKFYMQGDPQKCNVFSVLARYNPAGDGLIRFMIAKHFHFDMADLRTIDFDQFHLYFCDDNLMTFPELAKEKRRLEKWLGFALNDASFDRASAVWDAGSEDADDAVLHAVATAMRGCPLAGYKKLSDGRVDAFDVMLSNARFSGPGPTAFMHLSNRAKRFEDFFEENWYESSPDQSDGGWRTRDILAFLMNDQLAYADLRVEILRMLIVTGCIDANALVCEYRFDIDCIEIECDEQFDNDWVPRSGSIDSGDVVVPSTMLDIAVYEARVQVVEMLLEVGARVDVSLPWTRLCFDTGLVSEMKMDRLMERSAALWDKMRQIAPLVGRIALFVSGIYLNVFLPEGPAVKRARVCFLENAAVLGGMGVVV